MPVTAKLSRKFYDRLGDDIANELVDWFNAVDDTYRTQLHELNELNWKRFEAAMDARFAAFELKMDQRFAAVDARFAEFEVRIERRFTEQTRWMLGPLAGDGYPAGWVDGRPVQFAPVGRPGGLLRCPEGTRW